MPPDDPRSLDAFGELADEYAARIDEKPHNAHLDLPATLDLLPPVDGSRVLDAGCGSGRYAEALVDRGARVVAVDASPEMLAHARDRVGTRATVLHADLAEPLDFADDGEFDLVVSGLTLQYVRDLDHVFDEFARVVRPGGVVVASTHHPFDTSRRADDGDYFAVERTSHVWTGFGDPVEVPSYHRPLAAMLDPLLDAGFALDRLVEPTPTEAFREADPEGYEELSRRPSFLCLRATLG